MSLKDEFEKLDGDNQDKTAAGDAPDIEYYMSFGSARNLTFIHLNGDRELFNYGDLVKVKYAQEENEIRLTFRIDAISNVTLKGQNLLKLFNELADGRPKKISCTAERYAATKEKDDVVVTAIVIQQQEA